MDDTERPVEEPFGPDEPDFTDTDMDTNKGEAPEEDLEEKDREEEAVI